MVNIERQATTEQGRSPNSDSATGGEYLAFRLGNEHYGMEILKVQEIRGYGTVTRIANAPEFVKGVINLRGHIVPIVDMRIRFALEKVDYDEHTVVIILNLEAGVVGMVVDGVSDVVMLTSEQIRPAPELHMGVDTEYLTGLGEVEDRMLILVDIEKLMANLGMGSARAFAAAA